LQVFLKAFNRARRKTAPEKETGAGPWPDDLPRDGATRTIFIDMRPELR